jgi:peptidyl-dipeptidase A
MSDQNQFINEILGQVKPLHLEVTHAMWEAATTGSEAANQRQKEADAALMRFWADKQRYETARKLHEAEAGDALVARQLKRIYLSAAKAQQDEETIEAVTRLEAEVRQIFYNFRAEVGGARLSDNELDGILRNSADPDAVRRAWLASKQVGLRVAGLVRELAGLRNAAAQAQGFRDHFARSLTLSEVDEEQLLQVFEELEQASRQPFESYKAQLDAARAGHFGIDAAALRPWHFGDRFFQDAPSMGEFDLQHPFLGKDPVPLAKATYNGLGLEVEPILARSDLYQREGKDQHAFCLDMDRTGDVRTLNNLEATRRWTETLLHELGHAVYDAYIDRSLPWLLRTPPHSLSTEAVALMMGSLVNDPSWLQRFLGLSAEESTDMAQAAAEFARAEKLVFTRWCLVMTHFERGLYGNPEQNLDDLWWTLVQRYQRLTRPEELRGGEWAAKYHIALVPVYYHNYELGHLVSGQIQHCLLRQAGGLAGEEAGRWLVENVFRPGAQKDWAGHLLQATAEALNPQYFVSSLSQSL